MKNFELLCPLFVFVFALQMHVKPFLEGLEFAVSYFQVSIRYTLKSQIDRGWKFPKNPTNKAVGTNRVGMSRRNCSKV